MFCSGGSFTSTGGIGQRRPSFPQSSGDWNHGRRHHNGQRAPTAASMAEQQDDDDDDPPNIPTSNSTTTSLVHHAPCCRCSNALTVPGSTDSNQNSPRPQNQDGPNQYHNNVCTCQLSYVTLGGLTAPDGSRTSLSTAYTNNNKKPRRPRGPKPTVIFNVGGQIFETHRSTLKRFKSSFFADDDKMRAYFRPAHGDYFFDRDATAFGAVLNYLRTGELHVPTTMCGPALQTELEFWGIDELDIERCCWTQYNTWKTQSRSLEKLEYDRKFSTTQNLDMLRAKSETCWGKCRATLWRFLQDPGSSRAAKAYAWVSIIFVFVSIFSFCAETHPVFRVKPHEVRYFASVYKFFNLEDLNFDKPKPPKPPAMNSTGSSNSTGGGGDLGPSNAISPPAHMSGGQYGVQTGNDSEDYNDSEVYDYTEVREEADLPHPSLLIMDMCCLIFFTLEYITRFVCSPSKINFLRSFQNIIDFVAISPDYVELLFLIFDPVRREGMAVMDLMFILRMLRLCRIFRLIRHVPGLWILLYTLKASFNELMLMFVFLLIGMVVFATLMHFAEGRNGFSNIPVGFWWSVVTMTTVGYGDMFPETAAGYVIGSCCAVAGLLMIAFTVPIIVSNFVLYYTHVQYGLARRDRELERLSEDEQQHTGDEESQLGQDTNGSHSDISFKATAENTGKRSAPQPPKAPVDDVAIALGENVALTSPVVYPGTNGDLGNEQNCIINESVLVHV